MALGRILKSERRKRGRIAFKGAVILCWTDERGQDHYRNGRCTNISERGCSVELMESLPLRALISLRIPELDVSAFASVRHVTRKGMKINIGLEFGQAVRLPVSEQDLVEELQS
jgi:hypothetical protein